MKIVFWLCSICASAISLYSLLCFIRLMLTWFPQIAYSRFGRLMSAVCDPYLDRFRNISILRVGAVDFSPIISIGVLVVLSSIFGSIASLQRISVGVILAVIIKLSWSIVSSLLGIITILLLIRLVFHLLNKDTNQQAWGAIDAFFEPVFSWIRRTFFKGRFAAFRTPLIIALCAAIALQIIGSNLINLLLRVLTSLPF